MKRRLDELREATEQVDLEALRAGLPEDLSSLREAEPPAAKPQPPAANNTRWRDIALGGGIVAAALAMLVFLPGEPEAPSTRPEPPVVQALDQGLDGELQLEHVRILAQGEGRVAGTAQAPEISWERGLLRVEVQPDQGVDLVVRTQEGEVRVHGTVFEVERDGMGTTVRLERGSVGVVCGDEAELRLEPGQEHACVAWNAGRRLNQARELLEGGQHLAAIRAAERGLALADSGGFIEGELLLVRFHALHELGDEGASEAATAYLASPKALRASEVCALVQAEGCP